MVVVCGGGGWGGWGWGGGGGEGEGEGEGACNEHGRRCLAPFPKASLFR